jgi:exosortase/archaeosortase family protein
MPRRFQADALWIPLVLGLGIPLIENTLYHRVVGGLWQFTYLFLIREGVTLCAFAMVLAIAVRFLLSGKTDFRFRWTVLLLNCLLFALFVWVSAWRETVVTYFGAEPLSFARFALGVGTIVSAHLIFIDIPNLWKGLKRNAPQCALAAVTCLAVYALESLSLPIWYSLAPVVSKLVVVFVSLFTTEVVARVGVSGDMVISSPTFSAAVYSSCSGFEGLRLFLTFASAVLIVDWERLHRQFLLLFGVGIPALFLLNVVRIGTYFIFASWSLSAVDSAAKATLVSGIFHSNIGFWIYLVGTVTMVLFAYQMQARHPRKTRRHS